MGILYYHQISNIGLLLAGLLLATPVTAEMNYNMGKHQASNDAGQVSELMQDIGDHMVMMAGDLGYGTLNMQQQKNMAEHIRNMAIMMVELSQMNEQGVISDKKRHKGIKNMRTQMDKMMKEVSVGAMKPW
ncbi:hypothetical protein MNBD_GAMMA21-833 [hydrothermal vent metagenome]|uniref:Uncharacterized protein n=1 Tax=hydrothermal vent metagenome TaxID=652676 RepID=A0A3B1A665_9ZZZZ